MKYHHLPSPKRTLREQFQRARHNAIAAYAAEMAGSNLDLDPNLEAAGIEHLVKTGLKASMDLA